MIARPICMKGRYVQLLCLGSWPQFPQGEVMCVSVLACFYVRSSGKWTDEVTSDPGRMNSLGCEIDREMLGLLANTRVVQEVLEFITGPSKQTRQVQKAYGRITHRTTGTLNSHVFRECSRNRPMHSDI